jgi:hypothetical protein
MTHFPANQTCFALINTAGGGRERPGAARGIFILAEQMRGKRLFSAGPRTKLAIALLYCCFYSLLRVFAHCHFAPGV